MTNTPMKDIRERFEAWLANNEELLGLSDTEQCLCEQAYADGYKAAHDELMPVLKEAIHALEKAREDVHNFHRDYVHYEGGKVDKELNRMWREIKQAIAQADKLGVYDES